MLTTILTLGLALSGGLKEIEPSDDLVITESCRVKPGTYRIVDEGEPGVLRIEGEDLLVYMNGVTLVGAAEGAEPDSFAGTGIVVRGKRNVVFGGRVKGFKVGVHIDGGEGHWLMAMDVGGNFGQRLSSTPEKEVASDWLWPHENDAAEWATNYGAGIWVKGTTGVRILGCTGHESQNGILLDRADRSVVRGCDFSYNSGWGIALWRSSENEIARNRFDWCVRGYSHGVYDRGQDSAGILVFEQCHRNRFLVNSATHCGDGFFLYAGHETTKKTGEGGCNDNLVEANDFSHAVANGIEATFSTGNRFNDNRLDDCNYGIWAGYSRKSTFARNLIRNCTYAGIGIEHGSENVIEGNLIEDSRRAVWLWWDEDKQFLESVYGEKNRTDSADTVVRGNVIRRGEAGLYVDTSSRIAFTENLVEGLAGDAIVVTKGECPELTVEPAKRRPELKLRTWEDEPDARRGRKYIIVHEWGPYDFAQPMLHPARVDGGGTATFRVLGDIESLDVKDVEGDVSVDVRIQEGGAATLVVSPKGEAGSYRPFGFTAVVGETELAGSGTLLVTEWTVRHFAWEADPREDEAAWKKLLSGEPLVTSRTDAIDFPWQGGGPEGVPADRFATVAETKVALPTGEWEFITVSDDGVRVWVDGEPVIDNWTHHGPAEDKATRKLDAGEHLIRIEHFEIDGWSWLRFRLLRRD